MRAVLLIALIAAVNVRGTRQNASVQNWSTGRTAAIVLDSPVTQPGDALVGLVVVLADVSAYRLWRARAAAAVVRDEGVGDGLTVRGPEQRRRGNVCLGGARGATPGGPTGRAERRRPGTP